MRNINNSFGATLSIDSFIGQEVFIVGEDASTSGTAGLFVSTNIDEMENFLELKNPAVDFETKVLHGMLSTAEVIPNNLEESKVFLVITHTNHKEGTIVESGAKDGEELAKEIKNILDCPDEITSFDVEIEQIFVLYGYELKLKLAVDDLSIDDNALLKAEEVIGVIEQLNEKREENTNE